MKKILIIEDDQSFYQMCSTAIGLKGYTVVRVADGSEAIAKIEEEKPDLVLLDIVLPGMSGLDILQEVKSTDSLKATRVVMLTNFGTDTNVNRAMELGAEEYIMKYNVVPNELADKVASMLGDASSGTVSITG